MTSPRMNLRIDFKSGKPVHIQITEQIREDAVSGALRPGEPLPTIGALAAELRVNRNSVAKAFAELENAGLIESQPGRGYFLKEKDSPARKDTRRKLLVSELDQAIVQSPQAVQKTLRYSMLKISLGALYLGLAGGIAILAVRAGIVRGEVLAVLSTIAMAAILMPVRGRAQEFIDKVIFAKRYALPRTLLLIKAEAPAQPDLDTFVERVIERTESALDAKLELIRDYSRMRTLVNSFPQLRSARQPIASGPDLLMPVFSDNEVFGVLRLSRKPGVAYDTEDSEFLSAIGEQIAIVATQFKLKREKQEGEYALDIQRGLLPREIPQITGFTIAGAWQPARTVGGDYYDVFTLSETMLALVVADVSGKGVPAALIMANLQATVKAYAAENVAPKELCEKVNRAVVNSITPGKFITFFYAVLDSKAPLLAYTNAGHNPPLLVRRDGSSMKLEAGGAVLGVFPEGLYEQDSIRLLPGDQLIICTDGITEAADARGEEFGEENLLAILRKNRSAAANDLRDAIIHTVSQFCREDFSDDATLLAVAVDIPRSS